MNIREATAADGAACAAIYATYVRETAITFETTAPDAEEMAARIAAAHRWFVACEPEGGAVAGYAYAGPHKARAAYAWSCEVSVYLRPGLRRTGAGRALYGALLPRLEADGFRMLVAGTTLPNAGSVGLHRALGFTEVGVFRRIGFKHGAWHDVAWLQRPIGAQDGPPAGPPAHGASS